MSNIPDVMPVLSEGNHRNPRKGACFMELASYLAGERWSDHPRCTHPLLAELARCVNDNVTAQTRQTLAPMIPDVVGLVDDDPRVYAWIARDSALTALLVAPAERQGVMALGALRCERVLNELEHRPLAYVSPATEQVLSEVPHATQWARNFSEMGFGNARAFSRRSAPAIVHAAVLGIKQAAVKDPDAILVDLLRETIATYRARLGLADGAQVPTDQWHSMCALTAAR